MGGQRKLGPPKEKASSDDFANLVMPGSNHLVASFGGGVHGFARFRVFHPKANCASWVSHGADAQGIPRNGMELTLPAAGGGNDFIGLCTDTPRKSPELDSSAEWT